MSVRLINTLITLINVILYIITFFIGMRIILRFFSANPATPIVTWIYNLSSNLIYPFRGIFPDLNTQTGVLDMVAAIALIGYILAGYLLIWLFNALAASAEEVEADAAHYHKLNGFHRPQRKSVRNIE